MKRKGWRPASVRNQDNPVTRRDVLQSIAAMLATMSVSGCLQNDLLALTQEALASLEADSGGRLGVGILDSRHNAMIGHRLDERFGMCSTFKLLLAAVILREAQDGRLELDAPVHYSKDDLVFYSPVTSKNIEQGFMTVTALAETAQKTSDNTAANLLLNLIGGPAGFTAKLRELGDTTTRLDRYEPEMNLVPVGEVRDTTTPQAMATTVAELFTGTALSEDNKQILRSWMHDTRTGLSRLRAGFPAHWHAGDKTGTGIAPDMSNKYNDVAVVWRNDEDSILVVSAYFEADGYYDEVRDQDVAVLKAVGEIAAQT